MLKSCHGVAKSYVAHWTLSVAEVLSTAVPAINVVVVIVNGPVQALLGMKNGNEKDFEVPDCIVNRSRKHHRAGVGARLRPKRPRQSKLHAERLCHVLTGHDGSSNRHLLPREMVDGLIPSAT
jgi:hypothetical protein